MDDGAHLFAPLFLHNPVLIELSIVLDRRNPPPTPIILQNFQNFGNHRVPTPLAVLTPSRSPTPSPDELIIQSRGRRSTPDTWSPITVDRHPPRTLTPMTLRSSPRKETSLASCSPLSKMSPRRKLNLDDPGGGDAVLRSSITRKLSLLPSPKRPSTPKVTAHTLCSNTN